MRSKSLDELGSIFVEPIDGRRCIGAGGEDTIHLLMVTHTDHTYGLDGAKLLSRDGCRTCQNMQKSMVSKSMGAHQQGATNR